MGSESPLKRRERTWVQETDDYLERGKPPESDAPPEPTWTRLIFEPAAISLMIACIAIALNEFIQLIIPNAHPSLFIVAPVIGAFAGYRSWIVTQRRLLDGMDRLRKQLIELAVLFLLIKLALLMSETVPTVFMYINSWLAAPGTFFDTNSVMAFILTVISWLMGMHTARDLTAIRDTRMYVGELGPMPRLIRRFLFGGVVLLIFTTLGRATFENIILQNYEHISGSKINILTYFVAGLVMLGQLRYARLVTMWLKQNVNMATELKTHWLRYSLILIVGITLIALILPTGYALGIMDVIGYIFAVLAFIITFIYFIISLPLAWLYSLLLGGTMEPAAAPQEFPQMSPAEPQMQRTTHPLWQVLQSLTFWIIGAALLAYIVRSYIRDHPHFLESLQRFKLVRLVMKAWMAIQRWWYKTLRHLRRRVQSTQSPLRNKSQGGANIPEKRTVNPAGRNAVLNAYYNTLDAAHKQGIARRSTQTPNEYEPRLEHAVEQSDAVQGLTDLFVKAHYSLDDISRDDVKAARSNARAIRDTLRRRTPSENETSPDE